MLPESNWKINMYVHPSFLKKKIAAYDIPKGYFVFL